MFNMFALENWDVCLRLWSFQVRLFVAPIYLEDKVNVCKTRHFLCDLRSVMCVILY